MSGTTKNVCGQRAVFPKQGQFPSPLEFRRWMVRELDRLEVSAYALSLRISNGSNPNIVGDLKNGKNTNPKAQTMKAIFDALCSISAERAAK